MSDVWVSLSGCNTCINSVVCGRLGNCILLSVDQQMPVNTKKKRRLISRIRTYGNGSIEQIKAYIKVKDDPDDVAFRGWSNNQKGKSNSPNITNIEKLFIENLKKKR